MSGRYGYRIDSPNSRPVFDDGWTTTKTRKPEPGLAVEGMFGNRLYHLVLTFDGRWWPEWLVGVATTSEPERWRYLETRGE